MRLVKCQGKWGNEKQQQTRYPGRLVRLASTFDCCAYPSYDEGQIFRLKEFQYIGMVSSCKSSQS